MRGTVALLLLLGGIYLIYVNQQSLLPINQFFTAIGGFFTSINPAAVGTPGGPPISLQPPIQVDPFLWPQSLADWLYGQTGWGGKK